MMHIGKRIKEVFDAQPHERTVDWLAAQLNCKRANVYSIFRRKSLDCELLMQLSIILDHDFFADLSRDRLCEQGLGDREPLYADLMQSFGELLLRQVKKHRCPARQRQHHADRTGARIDRPKRINLLPKQNPY